MIKHQFLYTHVSLYRVKFWVLKIQKRKTPSKGFDLQEKPQSDKNKKM